MIDKKVIFLTEGGRSMGFGHLTRCHALSQAFMDKNYTCSFIVHSDDTVVSVLQDVKCENVQWLNGIQNIKSCLHGAILVVDTFTISEKMLNKLSEISKVVILDDFVRRDHNSRIVIDWTINAEKKFYPIKNPSSRYLLGNCFIALRQAFWNRPTFVVKPSIKNILITFGGGDIKNQTPRVLNLLQKQYPSVMKTIVIGKGCQNIHALEAMADDMTIIVVDANAEKMLSCMLNADIAIATGGQTLYELACVGVPTISVIVIDNQLDDISGWQEVGFTKHVGWCNDINLEHKILSCLHELEPVQIRQEISLIGQTLVDGQGARRIVERILEDVL